VNVLRGTLAAFAGAVGGADRITVAPFDQPLGISGKLARRLARNTQLILRDEAHLARVIDPAGGSYFFERLSRDMAEAAWGVLQEVEAQGGVSHALDSGWIRDRIDASHAARAKRVASRRLAVTGVSEFPSLSEEPPETVAFDAPAEAPSTTGSPGGDLDPSAAKASALNGAPLASFGSPTTDQAVGAFPVRRLAEPFEALRDRASNGDAPRVFLACMGGLAEHTGRSTWMTNLLAAGGIAVTANDGYGSAQDAVAAFREAQSTVAVICSSDARYAEDLPSLVPALRDAGATTILLAGRPSDVSKAAGIDGHVHVGADVLSVLVTLWEAGS
jgi:methylmalonyl-CoA mutase